MSARQRARLAKLKALLEEDAIKATTANSDEIDENEEESDDETARRVESVNKRAPVFQFSESSDSETDSNSDSEIVSGDLGHSPNILDGIVREVAVDGNSTTPVTVAGKQTSEKKPSSTEEDDMAYLDSLLNDTNGEYGASVDSSPNNNVDAANSVLSSLLRVDAKSLDIDAIMRRRFGGAAVDNGEAAMVNPAAARGRNRPPAGVGNSSSKLLQKRLIFGAPKEDWPRPPSFIGGGIGMSVEKSTNTSSPSTTSTYFKFVWSAEFARLHEQYLLVVDSGDVNRLALFLAQYPYHPEGLLQLAVVFARTGHVDRAADLVRRCVFCLECAFLEAFKPASGMCRMDPNIPENKALFIGLFRHMQISGMLGCPDLAADIAKIILSLDPAGDCYSVLLTLDHFLVASGRYDQLLQFSGLLLESSSTAAAITLVTTTAAGVAVDSSDVKTPWDIRDMGVFEHRISRDPSVGSQSRCLNSPLDTAAVAGAVAVGGNKESENDGGVKVAATTTLGESAATSGDNETKEASVPDIKNDVKIANSEGLASSEGGQNNSPTAIASCAVRLEHLPNWWLSTALATFNRERSAAFSGKTPSGDSRGSGSSKQGSSGSGGGTSGSGGSGKDTRGITGDSGSSTGTSTGTRTHTIGSDDILLKALSVWPIMLGPLLKKAGAQLGSSYWKPILDHSYFASVKSRLPHDSVLLHLADIYAVRNGTLWKREEVQRWLQSTASRLIASYVDDAELMRKTMDLQERYYSKLSTGPLRRYREAVVEDFQEEFPRLPPDANPLDPMLADPRALAGGLRFPGRGRGGGGRGGMDFNEWAANVLGGDGVLEGDLHAAGAVEMEMMREIQLQFEVAQAERRAREDPGNLDPNLPLMQLFLQTLLPWNNVRRAP